MSRKTPEWQRPDISDLEIQSDTTFTYHSRKKTGLRPRFYDQSTVAEVDPDHHQASQHIDSKLNEQVGYSSHGSSHERDGEEHEQEVRSKPQQSLASNTNPGHQHSSQEHSGKDSSQKIAKTNLSQNQPNGFPHVRHQGLRRLDPPDNVHQQKGLELNDPQRNNPNDPLLNNPQRERPAPAPQNHNWKTFIYYSLCLPESENALWCRCRYILALALHLFLFAQGITFILISAISIADDDSFGNYHLIGAKTISCLVGIFFVLVFFYWLLVSSCTFLRACPNPPLDYHFYFLKVIWFLLVLFGTGLLFAMLIKTIDEGENAQYYFCQQNASTATSNPNHKGECFNFIIVWALVAIIIYLLYCVAVFCVIVVKTIVGFRRH